MDEDVDSFTETGDSLLFDIARGRVEDDGPNQDMVTIVRVDWGDSVSGDRASNCFRKVRVQVVQWNKFDPAEPIRLTRKDKRAFLEYPGVNPIFPVRH